MIQVNLIPDLKADFLKTQRTKGLVITIAVLVCAAFAGLVVLLFIYVNVAQKEHSNNLSEDIATLVDEYRAIEDIDKIVTIQRQLESLPGLHNDKPLISRMITYLAIITPEQVEFRSIDLSFESLQIQIAGSAAEVSDVNRFANTIKNAVYTVGEDVEREIPAFEDVVLNTINSDTDGAQFDLNFTFDLQLFSNHDEVTLSIPAIDSTSSEIERPKISTPQERESDLFDSEAPQ